jgi:hypothetical protein
VSAAGTLNPQLSIIAGYRYPVALSGHRLTAAENVATTRGVQTINRLYSYDATYRLDKDIVHDAVFSGIRGTPWHDRGGDNAESFAAGQSHGG